jgi:hypothetical protein
MSSTKIDDTAETSRNEQIESIRKYNKEEQRQSIDITFYEIYPIQIMIQSNVPNKPDFALKSSMFITEPRPEYAKKFKEKYAEMPFFTNEFEYPYTYLVKLEKYEIMDFFFLREEFELKLKKYLLKTLGKDKITRGASDIEKEENSKKNVMYMLLLLFKTVYPKENNINSSFTEFLDQYSSGINFNSVLDLQPTYTYLKESGTEYTVLRALYLNDIFNNNVYRKLFEAYYDYYVWCDKEKKKVMREEKINKAKIERLIRDYKKLDNDINVIGNAISQISGQDTSTRRYELIEYGYNLNSLSNIFELLKLYQQYNITGSNKSEIKNKMNNIAKDKIKTVAPNEIKITNTEEARNFHDKFKGIVEFKDSEGYIYRGKVDKVDKEFINFVIHYQESLLGITIKIKINSNPVFITSGLYTNKIINTTNLSSDKKKEILQIFDIKIVEKGNVSGNITFTYPYDKDSKIKNFLITDAEEKNKVKCPSDGKCTSSRPIKLSDPEFNNDIDQFIEKINKSFIKIREKPHDTTKTIETDMSPENIIFDALDRIETFFNYVSNKLAFNRDTKSFIKNLIQPYTTYKESKLLVDQYFKYKKVDINFPLEKYDGYMTFINVLKQYLNPVRESTNRTFQDVIIDYANNRTGNTPEYPQFVIVADSLYKCFDKFNPKCTIIKDKSRRETVKAFIDTGISEININVLNQHKYEINVHLDLVEGHLTPQNTHRINCVYQDSRLADRFEILVNRKRQGDWLIMPAPFTKIPPDAGTEKPSRFARMRDAVGSVVGRFTSIGTQGTQKVETAKKGGKRKHRRTRRIKK